MVDEYGTMVELLLTGSNGSPLSKKRFFHHMYRSDYLQGEKPATWLFHTSLLGVQRS